MNHANKLIEEQQLTIFFLDCISEKIKYLWKKKICLPALLEFAMSHSHRFSYSHQMGVEVKGNGNC